jgi:ribonuclease E/ribonuclease G
MSRELVIEATPFGLRAALLEDGRLLEISEAASGEAPRGAVVLGRVRTIDRALDAAFVDCGSAEDGWLGARDARLLSGGARGAPIDRQLREGQAVVVQVRREAQGGKGPRLTGDVALSGPCLVWRPRRPGAGLAERPAAKGAGAAELAAEAERLRRLWQTIEDRAQAARPPALLHGPDDPVAWLLAEQLGAAPERILIADPATLVRARGYLETWRPALLERLEHLPDALAASGAEEQLAAALEPVVPLSGGGALTIQPTAALTAIDVDGGGRRPLEVDLAAAAEVARQLRLRQLGGTIVVDFVDLAGARERERLAQALRRALADDPTPAEVFPMSPLGLVEISRQRRGPSLAERFGRSCPACGGGGLVPSVRRCCENLMRELAERPPARLCARVAPDLHAYLNGAAAAAWQAFGERQGTAPALQSDALLAPGDYRLEEVR